ncbi:MAG TPA: helix-turn-helix domain-containing protein [Pyrinomonadaceae bacterium]|nr:helix-turn-helix domain-containing protein [Pyrinomonadaceae bacterium]
MNAFERGPTLDYREHKLPPPLDRYVECAWFVSDTTASASPAERILPDGCIEWIFHLGLPFEYLTAAGEWQVQPRSFVVGELTRFLMLKPASRPNVMGIRFRPRGAYRFFPLPLTHLTDRVVSTSDIWRVSSNELEDRICSPGTDQDRMRVIEGFLLRAFSSTSARPLFESAVSRILQTRGQQRIKELAEELGSSTRQLEREFRAAVGLSPKAFARIARLQNLLHVLGENKLREWANLAVSVGYSDQPHMTREFREFVGQSPTQTDLCKLGKLSRNFISPQRLAELLGEG